MQFNGLMLILKEDICVQRKMKFDLYLNTQRKSNLRCTIGASLVVQWVRICLSIQGKWIWSLIWEDFICRGATNPTHHSYWAWSHWSLHVQSLCFAAGEATAMGSPYTVMKSCPCSPQLEKACAKQWRLSTAKNK